LAQAIWLSVPEMAESTESPTPPADAEIESSWHECFGLGKQSIVLVYQNKFQEAEQILEVLSGKAATRAADFPTEPDPRSWPVMLSALISLLRGASQLEKEQLTTFSANMEQAEELVELGPDWPGKDLNRAGARIILGGTKIGQKKYVSGVWKLVRAVTLLSGGGVIKAAINYEGREKEACRPFAMLINALAHLLTSGLPSWTRGAASWIMGDAMDRREGLQLLETLYREDTLLKPVACQILLDHYLDIENKGTRMDEHGEHLVPELLKYANSEYPDGVLFSNARCTYEARQRNIEAAWAIAEKTLSISEFKGIQLVANGKLGLYGICMLDWTLAAKHYRAGLEILKDVDRRALCPVYSCGAALCHIMAGEFASAQEMIDVVKEYRKSAKKDWGDEDKYAFHVMEFAPSEVSGYKDHPPDKQGEAPFRPFMSLMLLFGPGQQIFKFMKLEDAQRLIDMVQEYMESSEDIDSKAMAHVVLADAYLALKKHDEAVQMCDAGLLLKTTAGAEEMGTTAYLHFVKAATCFEKGDILTAKTDLQTYSKSGTSYYGFNTLSFRAAELSLSVGFKFESQYQEIVINAGAKEEILKAISDENCHKEIQWDFTLAQHSVGFTVMFQASAGEEWMELQRIEQHSASLGPVSGSFQPDQPGILKVAFDNSFSWQRKKSVTWRIEPQLEDSLPSNDKGGYPAAS